MTDLPPLLPSRSMSSRRQAVLEVIRRHFRQRGSSPSYDEIGEAVGLRRQHVGRWLAELQHAGLITYVPGRARSIALVDRMANFSDTELELACAGRNWTVVKPGAIASAVATAHPLDPRPLEDVPEFGLTLIEALKHIE